MRTYSLYLYSDTSPVPVLTFENLLDDSDARAFARRRLNESPRHGSIEVFEITEDPEASQRLVFNLKRGESDNPLVEP